MAAKAKLLAKPRIRLFEKVVEEGLPRAPLVRIEVDREKAGALGVSFTDVNDVISTHLGSVYVNDFINRGRAQRVIVQADESKRVRAEDILTYSVRNKAGEMMPLSAFARIEWAVGPTQIVGFNGYPSLRLTGEPKPGYTSGDAIAEMERLMSTLPKGFGYEWTGQSLQEKLAGSQAAFLLGLSVLFVFLCLAALYESWAIPFSVMLAAPLGIVGCVVGGLYPRATERRLFHRRPYHDHRAFGEERHSDHRVRARSAGPGTARWWRRRSRPRVYASGRSSMTVARLHPRRRAADGRAGASAKSQQALGIGVFGGMVSATVLTVFFVPVFFVAVMAFFVRRRERRAGRPAASAPASP